MKPYYSEGGITIYNCDCREIQSSLAGITAVITDPPYGMAYHGRIQRGRNSTGKRGDKSRHFAQTIHGDREPFDPAPWLIYSTVLFWGYQHFADRLPCGSVLVWLKRYDSGFGSFMSDADLAWLKGGCGVYCKRDISLKGESSAQSHPTQKPLGIMRWCFERAKVGKNDVILDPFMGGQAPPL